MPNCPKCGAPVKEGQKFCPKCGAKIERVSVEISAKIEILKKRVEKDPLNAELYIQLGGIYYQNDLLKEALTEYQKAVNIGDSNYDAHLKSGDIYLKMKEFNKAEDSYKKALGLRPKSQEAMLGLFWVYYAEGRVEEVIGIGEEVASKLKNLDVHNALKEMYLKKDMKDKALIEMETISNLATEDKENLKEMAKYHWEKNEDEKAFEYYQKVLELDPKDIDARFRMGEYFCAKGDFQKTIEYLKEIVEELPHNIEPFAHFYLALAYINRKELDNAIKEIDSVVPPNYEELMPRHKKLFAETYYKTGAAVLEIENLSVAINYLDKATKYEPQNMEYKKKLEETKKKQKAIKVKTGRKRRTIAISAASVIVIVVIGWWLTHGKILIQITPPETASVYVGEKPLTRDLGKGRYLSSGLFFGMHKVTVEKAGYEKWEEEVKVGYGKTIRVNAGLIPIYGGIKVNSIPSGAEVYLDGKLLGKTPLTANEILATKHAIKLRLEGYKDYRKSINISAEKVINLNFTLLGLQGEWHGKLIRDYEGCQIYRMYRGKEQWAPPSYISAPAGYVWKLPIILKIEQSGNKVAIDYNEKGNRKGRLLGKISGNSFTTFKTFVGFRQSDGTISKIYGQKIKLEGTISANWDRIEGYTYNSEYSRTKWWATRQK